MQSRNEVRDEPERRRANSLVLIVFQNGKQPKAVQIKKKDKFNNMLAAEQAQAAKLEASYYRSVKKRPFEYSRLAQQND